MPPPSKDALLDGISVVSKGIHSGISPRLLPSDQLSFAVNCTFRNGLPRTRPVFRRVALTYADLTGDPAGTTKTRATKKLFQGAAFHQAYAQGENSLVASIGGRLFRYSVGTNGVVQDISLTNDLNSSINPNCWMWQSEDFLIVQNGQKDPLFFDGAKVRRSLGMGGNELPVGGMGVYVQGRNWMALVDVASQQPTQQFIGGDLAYSHGYNDGYGGRAAVLKIEENSMFSGGGAFSVPISAGSITAMSSAAIADASLGQGPLQVFTRSSVFSVQVPVLREDWANTQYPLMTIGLPNYGATGALAVSSVNGDLWYRSPDGIRSYQVARRDFNTWVNTPLSVEVERILNQDTDRLLDKTSTVVFDNRLLLTCFPQAVRGRGTSHGGLVALDFNNISNLTTRSNPVYDGLWTGLNILQLLKGTFNGVERCFAFALDCNADIVLYEILADGRGMFDHDGTNDVGVESYFESKSMGWKDNGNVLKKLLCGDLYLDKLAGPGTGTISFDFKFRSDEDPFWQQWHSFNLCAPVKDCSTAGCPTFQPVKEQYRTYLRLPDPTDRCSAITRRMFRTGYEFQIRFWAKGYWQLNRLHVWAAQMSDSVVTSCPTSQNCTLLPCANEGSEDRGNPGFVPGVLTGITWEDPGTFITTETGTVIREEGQDPVGGPGTFPGEDPNNPQQPPTPPVPALPSWPIPPPMCDSPQYWGPIKMTDPVRPTMTREVAIDPSLYPDPVTYLSEHSDPGCLNEWCQETWTQFLKYAHDENKHWTQARFVWAFTSITGWQGNDVFPHPEVGPYTEVSPLNTIIAVEFCL